MKLKIWNPVRDKRILRYVAVAVVLVASVIIIKDEIIWQLVYTQDYSASEAGEFVDDSSSEVCNVQGITLRGNLVNHFSPSGRDADGNSTEDQVASENIVALIQGAEEDSGIRAILLEINSYGGFPTAAEEVADALRRAKKPTVALIREGGASAAYWVATGADFIFASKNSDVGGIGVTRSYLDASRQNRTEGLTYNQLSSGKYKDTGDPDKALSAEEKNLLMRDVRILHQNFINAVAENRKLNVEKVNSLADGSTMLGEMALENGLIDNIGGMPEVKEYLKEKIGEVVEICR